MISENLRLELMRKGGEIAIFTLSFLFLLGLAFLVVQGIRTPEYTSFILCLILYIGLLILESLFFYGADMKSPFAQRSIFAISSLLPASGLLFLVCLYRDPVGLWIKTLMAASLLLALKLQLQMMNARVGQDGRLDGNVLGELINEVDGNIKNLRSMAMDLRPTFLEDSSMIQLFTLYGRLFTERTGIPVDVRGEEAADTPMRVKDNLYRIYQEALGNIIKHARADQVEVRVENGNGSLMVTIKDNGRGFDPVREMDGSKGIGLMSMRERCELLGGVFRIKSTPGRGCMILLEAPLK